MENMPKKNVAPDLNTPHEQKRNGGKTLTKKKKNKWNAFHTIGAIVTVAVAVILGLVFFGGNKQKSASSIAKKPQQSPGKNKSANFHPTQPSHTKPKPPIIPPKENKTADSLMDAVNDNTRKTPDAPFDVDSHVRNLPKGWHASEEQKKAAEAMGCKLGEGQTYVNGYTKNKECA